MEKKKLWQGLTTTTAVLLTVSVVGSGIADTQASTLNSWLGTSNYKIVEVEGEATGDGTYFKSEFQTLEELFEAEVETARQLSAEGSVLLKNDNQALPLDIASETVTLWGLNSHNPTLGGMIGSSPSYNAETGQKSYPIEEALKEKGFSLNEEMISLYSGEEASAYARKNGHSLMPSFGMTYENSAMYAVGELPTSMYTKDVLESADDTAAIVVISRDNSEAADYNPNMANATEGDDFERPLALSTYEKDMIALAKEHSAKVIVLVNSDNPMEIDELKKDKEIDSILWTGAPGLYGFLGVADILSGEVSPSGHLSDTYAVNSASAPAMVNFGVYTYTNSTVGSKELTETNKADWYLVESEGIYSGYKYYETRYEDLILGNGNANAADGSSTGSAWNYADEISYPFGYGMSYTTFEQTLDSVELEVGGMGTATITVTNTGDMTGKSVVELYVQAPYTEGGLEKSAIQLLDFGKTQTLEPGASETLVIEFDPKYMASYDETLEKDNETLGVWVLEAGDYYFAIGNGVHEALNSILANKQGSTEGLISITPDEAVDAAHSVLWNLAETDTETYSTGVENALQDADLNHLIENAVDYTTRTDWTKGWTPVETLTPTEEMMVGLTNRTYSLTENGEGLTWGEDHGLKWIDLLLTDEEGNYTGTLDLEDEKWDLLVEQMTLDEAINFVENGGSGMPAIASVQFPYNAIKDGPIGFAFDQVPGYSAQWTESNASEPTYVAEDDKMAGYSSAVMPTEPVVASTWNKELVEREGEILGESGLWANIPSIFAPGLNLHRTPYCARNHEYYSEDAMLTNLLGMAVCKGGKTKGFMFAPKHFAFNHQELNRSGLSTFFAEQAGRENELRAFQGALESNYAGGVMTAFNRIGTVYAGAAEGTQVQIARNEWGYTGWFTTDLINGADYMNWKDGVLGGSSTMLSNSDTYAETEWGTMVANKDKIASDTVFQEKMKNGIKYFLYTALQSSAANGIKSTTESVYVKTWWQNMILGIEIVFAVLTLLFGVLYVKECLKKGSRKSRA